MAFVSDPTQDDDEAAKQKQEQQDRLVNSNPVTGGGTSIFGQAPAGEAATNGNAPPKSNSSGTGWVGIDSYLNANKDQAAGMGQKLAGTVNTQAQDASDAVGKLSDSFNQQAQQNTVNFDPTSVSKDISDATSLKAGSTYDPNDVSDFGKYAGAAYNGPADLTGASGYSDASQKVTGAQNAVGELGREPGREQLLNQTYGSGSTPYTRGESTLDNGLLQASPDAQKAMSDVARQWSGIGSLLGTANTKAQAAAAAAKATDAATQKAAADALGTYATGAATGGSGALGDWSKGIYGQTDAAGSSYKAAQDALTAAEGSNQWTPAQLQALGLDPTMHSYGVSLNANPGYVTAGANAPTLANAASADAYAQQAALARLAGVLPGGGAAIGNPLLNQANASQAGTAAGVNGNAMATLSPTYLSDVAAAKAGVGQQLLNTFQGYEQGRGNADGFALNSYDPTTQTASIQMVGPNSVYGGNQILVSADPNSPYYIGNTGTGTIMQNGLITPGTVGPVAGDMDFAGLQASGGWQNLMATLNSTVGGAPAPDAVHIGTTGGGPGPQIRGARFAHGGEVAAPVKEPRIPKMPKADFPMPHMPHLNGYAAGGAVKYPIHTPAHALASLERANREGSDAEKKVVARQVAAHYPHLSNSGAAQATPTAPPAPVPPAKPAPYSIRTAPEAMASLDRAEAAGDAHAVEVLRRQIAAHYPTHARDLHWRGITGALKAPTPKNFKAGGPVPGRAVVKGDSYANDTVPAVVSPGELIIDRETLADKGPAGEAARYLADYLKRRNGGR